MKKSFLALAVAALSGAAASTRASTRDVAFTFRMGAGFAGDVNRTHPASIEPVAPSTVSPPTAFGQAVLIDSAGGYGVRPYTTGDTATTPYGVTVRPYPFQQSSATNYGQADLGDATPPATGALDVVRAGYVMVKIPAGQAAVKGGPVYIWTAASSGVHIKGGFEATNPSTSGVALTNCTFNGPADATGVTELSFNV